MATIPILLSGLVAGLIFMFDSLRSYLKERIKVLILEAYEDYKKSQVNNAASINGTNIDKKISLLVSKEINTQLDENSKNIINSQFNNNSIHQAIHKVRDVMAVGIYKENLIRGTCQLIAVAAEKAFSFYTGSNCTCTIRSLDQDLTILNREVTHVYKSDEVTYYASSHSSDGISAEDVSFAADFSSVNFLMSKIGTDHDKYYCKNNLPLSLSQGDHADPILAPFKEQMKWEDGKCINWPFMQKSLFVMPIRYSNKNKIDPEQSVYKYSGFIAINSDQEDAFEPFKDVHLGGIFADLAYILFSMPIDNGAMDTDKAFEYHENYLEELYQSFVDKVTEKNSNFNEALIIT